MSLNTVKLAYPTPSTMNLVFHSLCIGYRLSNGLALPNVFVFYEREGEKASSSLARKELAEPNRGREEFSMFELRNPYLGNIKSHLRKSAMRLNQLTQVPGVLTRCV